VPLVYPVLAELMQERGFSRSSHADDSGGLLGKISVVGGVWGSPQIQRPVPTVRELFEQYPFEGEIRTNLSFYEG